MRCLFTGRLCPDLLTDLDLITPALDGTILPGITRDCILKLAAAHSPNNSSSDALSPTIPKLHVQERIFTIDDLCLWLKAGVLLETFGTGTASILCPVSKIGYDGRDLDLPTYDGGVGPVSMALWERMVEIQEGKRNSQWLVPCE